MADRRYPGQSGGMLHPGPYQVEVVVDVLDLVSLLRARRTCQGRTEQGRHGGGVDVNRPNRQVRRRHGKSDTVDAVAAARAVISGQATVIPKTAASFADVHEGMRRLRDLVAAGDHLQVPAARNRVT